MHILQLAASGMTSSEALHTRHAGASVVSQVLASWSHSDFLCPKGLGQAVWRGRKEAVPALSSSLDG